MVDGGGIYPIILPLVILLFMYSLLHTLWVKLQDVNWLQHNHSLPSLDYGVRSNRAKAVNLAGACRLLVVVTIGQSFDCHCKLKMPVEPHLFVVFAANVLGLEPRRLEDRDRFRAMFGCSSLICSELWLLIETNAGAIAAKVKPCHLLWALIFLELYKSIWVLAAIVGTTEKTYMKWVRLVVSIISLADNVVSSFAYFVYC